ncbi:MAG: TIGR02391 family protein [Chloroflexi bacterium]|nr:TIGR02391 family protein [Chloroflexota bacterium]
MPALPEFGQPELESICGVLADTQAGLTGSEIGSLLAHLGIPDPMPAMTKRHRLFQALAELQEQTHSGNIVGAFVQEAMNPVRYTANRPVFESRRGALNTILAFCGYSLGEDGKLRQRAQPAHTLTEAEEAAGRLRSELARRGVHLGVLRFCQPELLQENYFHAVFEATKSVADRIREMAEVDGDGSELVDRAFGIGQQGLPLLAFNSLRTENERSEHSGLMQLMKGMFGVFRNVTAHAPKIRWPISEQDALDLLVIASYLHRRLDRCVRTSRPT